MATQGSDKTVRQTKGHYNTSLSLSHPSSKLLLSRTSLYRRAKRRRVLEMTDDEAHYSGIHEDDPDIQSPSEDESLDLQVEASVMSDPYISNGENNEELCSSAVI